MLHTSEPTEHIKKMVLQKEKIKKVTLRKALFQIGLESGTLDCAVSAWRDASAYQELVREFSFLPSNIVQKLGEYGRYEEAYLFGIEQLEVLKKLNNESELYLRYKIGNELLKQKKCEEALRVYEHKHDHYKDINIFLHYAAEDGNLEATKFLIENKGIDNKIYRRKSLLHCAIQGNNFEVVRFLVEEKGVDFNIRNPYGITPIQYASKQGDLDVVKFLVEKGADVNSSDNLRVTCVHYAAEIGNLGIVKFLVESGADFRSCDDDLKTPLHYAAEKGSFDVVKFLVENGADFRSYTKDGKTPLLYAAEKNSIDIVKFLVKCGDDINSTDRDGKTYLHCAADMNNLSTIRFLIQKGANVNVINKNHMTPLDYIFEKLDPMETIDYKGSTQLHYAVYYGRVQLVQNLLKSVNSNQLHDFINRRTKGGNTALDLAIKAGNKDIIKLLDWALEAAPYTCQENVG